MRNFIFSAFIFAFVTACSTTPNRTEKAWIDDYTNSGILTAQSIIEGKLNIEGSNVSSYSNIDEAGVNQIDGLVSTMLKRKYGEQSISNKSEEVDARFSLSYEVLQNSVAQSQSESDAKACFVSTRDMIVSIHVYDNRQAETAWQGRIQKRAVNRNCNTRSETNHSDEGFLEAFVEVLVGGLIDAAGDAVFGTYPEAPSVAEVSQDIFQVFDDNINVQL